MDAGRGLDALIAEKIMGWVWKRGEHWDITSVPGERQLHLLEVDDEIRTQRPGEFTSIGDWPPPDGRIIWSHLPPYSSDIAAAWLVWAKAREMRPHKLARFWSALRAHVQDRLDMKHLIGDAQTALFMEPADICNAALEAEGVRTLPDWFYEEPS